MGFRLGVFSFIDAIVNKTAVIPGCASWRRPGIHTPRGGYGFSDAQLRIVARAKMRVPE